LCAAPWDQARSALGRHRGRPRPKRRPVALCLRRLSDPSLGAPCHRGGGFCQSSPSSDAPLAHGGWAWATSGPRLLAHHRRGCEYGAPDVPRSQRARGWSSRGVSSAREHRQCAATSRQKAGQAQGRYALQSASRPVSLAPLEPQGAPHALADCHQKAGVSSPLARGTALSVVDELSAFRRDQDEKSQANLV
jgi:hypothetical protein